MFAPPSFDGSWFHCLQATSHALQPMHKVESVKNPTGWPGWKATGDDGAPVKVAGWSGSGAGDPTAWGDAAAWGEGDAAGVGDAGLLPDVQEVEQVHINARYAFSTLTINALPSCIDTFGSPTRDVRSLTMSPTETPM